MSGGGAVDAFLEALEVLRVLNRFTTPIALRMMERDSNRFDARNRVETATWVMLDEVTVEDGSVEDGRPYVPTPPRLLRALLRQCVGDPRGWTFVDFGSGRGRALIMAARYGFERVVGVEFARELHETAGRNIDAVRSTLPDADSIELVHGDACGYELPSGPLALFFNNPFGGEVFDSVASNIEASYREEPRAIVVMYQTMRVEDPGHTGSTNLSRLADSPVLSERTLRFRNPIDALALRPFMLRAYTAEPAESEAGVDAPPDVPVRPMVGA